MSVQTMMDRFYHGAAGWQNGTELFHEIIGKYLAASSRALEIGPGLGGRTSSFLANNVDILDGLDIDNEALENPFLHSCAIYDGGLFPLASNQYDVAVADYVLEHLENPAETFAEASRVLKTGGYFIFRTPNLWHYVSIVTALTPHSFHLRIANRVRQLDEASHDPFPTFFRANRMRRIAKLLSQSGLEPIEIHMVEKEPSYLQFSKTAFILGVGYERLVNSSPLFQGLRANIFAVARKS